MGGREESEKEVQSQVVQASWLGHYGRGREKGYIYLEMG